MDTMRSEVVCPGQMMDINKEVSSEVKAALKELPSNIRTRILY